MRIAFAGASGTGKSTLANFLAKEYGLPLNPVGSRSVSAAMGFASSYDVDKAGKRSEFQRRLVIEKRVWEDEHESFVTDRTTLDNLAYTTMHDVHCIDEKLLLDVVTGLRRYTHIFYCPVAAFCDPGVDPVRISSVTYHELFDVLIRGLIDCYVPAGVQVEMLDSDNLKERKARLRWCLQKE